MALASDFHKIAQCVTFPTDPFINGQFVPPKQQKRFPTINPATGEQIALVGACDAHDLDIAVQGARDVFKNGSWAKCAIERQQKLLRLVDLIGEHREELAVLESLDSGKPITDCLECDIPQTQVAIRWFAQVCDKLNDKIGTHTDESLAMVIREPLGVVATVLPWNYPLMMLAWKLGPALASGNALIVKPAEQTSLSTLKLAELVKQAGIPDGVFQVLPGLGEEIGKAIGLHPQIESISFTGSTEVGRLFLQYAAQSNLKEITLECGGKSPSVVLSDASDYKQIAEQVVFAAMTNNGQNCCANGRLIVHKDVKQALLPEILHQVKTWNTGDPLDPNSKLGSINSAEHFDKIMGYLNHAQEQGATVLTGGHAITRSQGWYIEPTVFDNVSPSMTIAKEEVFGPVLCIIEASSDEQALAMANDTAYGLHASVYTDSMKRGLDTAKALEAGNVSVNSYCEGDMSTPFGGFKQSGFGGKDNSLAAFDQYTQKKTVWVDLAKTK